ncbi:MAG: tetratricopeptide repeat protein [Candidatus Nitrosotenuis sp.]
MESKLNKNDENYLILKYVRQSICYEGFELYEHGKYDKAAKQFKKVLKDEPDHANALFGMAKCLIAQGRRDEARGLVDNLMSRFPEQDEVKELKQALSVGAV